METLSIKNVSINEKFGSIIIVLQERDGIYWKGTNNNDRESIFVHLPQSSDSKINADKSILHAARPLSIGTSSGTFSFSSRPSIVGG